MKNVIKTHWVADIYPLNNSDVDALAADIKANGQIVPIKALKDGRIIDGRNRLAACRIAGVEPVVEIVNPDGEDVTDDEAFALATSCNSMRRDLSASVRACLAAQAWKRLHPDREGLNAGGRGKKTDPKSGVSFETFAKQNFKVGKCYAEQALAIANHDPSGELLEIAKTQGIDGAYATMQEEKKDRETKRLRDKLLEQHPDISELVAGGKLKVEEAIATIEHRTKETRDREAAAESNRRLHSEQLGQLFDYCASQPNLTPEQAAEYYKTSDYQLTGKQPLSVRANAVADFLTKTAEIIERKNNGK